VTVLDPARVHEHPGGMDDGVHRAQAAGRPTGQSFSTLIVAALMYWILTIILSFFQARLERRLAAGDRNR